MIKLCGSGTALITPFKNDFSIDYDSYRKLVKRQIDAGIHFLVPLGTTAETPCLEDDEKIKLLQITVEEAKNKIPIIAGAGSNCTSHTIKNIKLFEKTGIDGFLIVTPYYIKPTQNGLYLHFKTIAESTNKPIVIYNVPGRTGVNMTSETCLKLAEIKNIIATKEASSNYSQISEIIKNAPSGFSVLSGNDDETLSLFVTGAKGVISVAANVAPNALAEFLNLLLAGNYLEAQNKHHQLVPLFKNCFVETNPIPVKAAMSIMKLINNTLRPPLYPAAESTKLLLEKTLKKLDLT